MKILQKIIVHILTFLMFSLTCALVSCKSTVKTEECTNCNYTGVINCPDCHVKICVSCDGEGMKALECVKCSGSGYLLELCYYCDGRGCGRCLNGLEKCSLCSGLGIRDYYDCSNCTAGYTGGEYCGKCSVSKPYRYQIMDVWFSAYQYNEGYSYIDCPYCK